MTDAPELLLANHLKTLRLPTFLREHDKPARICAAQGVDHVRYLARLTELELIDRERRMVGRRIKSARFPAVKSLDSFDFKAIPSLNKMMVLDLARCDWIERRENVIALGPSGTGKTHVALGLGLAACQKGMPVAFVTAASLVNELMEARDGKRLLRLQRQLAKVSLLIIPSRARQACMPCRAVNEPGFVPLSKTGAELLSGLIPQRYERGSTLITSNLPFEEWTANLWHRTIDQRIAGSADPPREHPGNEWRKLQAQSEQIKTRQNLTHHHIGLAANAPWNVLAT